MRFRPSFLVAAFVVSLAACGGGGDGGTTGPNNNPNQPTGPTNPGSPSGPTETNQVEVNNDTFSPANIKVAPNTTVTWTWGAGAVTHNVTFADGTSGDYGEGHVFTKLFSTAGTFNYHCTIHGGMAGSVLVQ